MKSCSVCGSKDTKKIYTPIRSKIGLELNICEVCGMVFADGQEIDERENIFVGLSCDADYSTVRVGKAQMVNGAMSVLERNISKLDSVLDMSSARGHFVRAVFERYKPSIIDCIEPDEYMCESYKNDHRFRIHNIKYKEFKSEIKYDLIYSCHSLEHYRNPRTHLEWIRGMVSDTGFLYVEVPNIEYVSSGNILDEYFYDMHLQYFDRHTLKYLLGCTGFDVYDEYTDRGSVIYLCKPAHGKKVGAVSPTNYEVNKSLVEAYAINIAKTRSAVNKRKDEIQSFINSTESPIIVGCGRILNYLVERADLDISSAILVDNYLSEATNTLFGKKLIKLKDLNGGIESQAVLICAQSSNDALRAEIKSKFRNCKIKSLFEIIS